MTAFDDGTPLPAAVVDRGDRRASFIVGENESQMVITVSAITCPKCGHRATEKMPTDACQFFDDCKGCGERLKPKPGDSSCVLLSRLGSVPADASRRLLRLTTIRLSPSCPSCCGKVDRERVRVREFRSPPRRLATHVTLIPPSGGFVRRTMLSHRRVRCKTFRPHDCPLAPISWSLRRRSAAWGSFIFHRKAPRERGFRRRTRGWGAGVPRAACPLTVVQICGSNSIG